MDLLATASSLFYVGGWKALRRGVTAISEGQDRSVPSDVGVFGNYWIDRPIMARFETVATHYPNKIAVEDGNLQLTYSELWSVIFHLAHRIETTVPEGPVGILLSNGALFPAAILACLAAGRLCVPIDLSYPDGRNKQIVRDACLAAIIVDDRSEASRIAPSGLLHLDIAASRCATGDETIAFGSTDSPAIILYTSGSTGRPKGICNNQRAISYRVAQYTNTCRLSGADRFILLSSSCTIADIRDIPLRRC